MWKNIPVPGDFTPGAIVADERMLMKDFAVPEAHVDSWLEAARSRRSRRSYDGNPVPAEALDRLIEMSRTFRPSPVARALVIPSAPADIFTGIVGSYGRISDAPSAVAFAGITDAPGVDAAVGYTGEALILEATVLGLSTCWVAGMFKQRRVADLAEIGGSEKVFAISPLGTAVEAVSGTERMVYRMKPGPKPRKSAEEVAPGSTSWPGWARAAVEAARLAPSAMNRQPWRFTYDDGSVVVSVDGPDTPKISKRVDCGIAMLHFELGARHHGTGGTWERLDHRTNVARFISA
ncbi:MAG: nitroreductase family protein [Coriobacteriia bacterium]|nr:nitroreductase family protein [Coriobacteriia bacterium]